MTTKQTYRITGTEAIRLAERDGLTIRREDTGLLYVEVEQVGWTGDATGYNISDYFTPKYQGPDADGIEPTWADAQ